jgi:CheY-like chemotaxis protein/phosphoribosyl 1,2-cyclic phosphodiesterase
VQVRFWGTRGSLPSPGHSTLRYGGNTSCVELRTAAGTLIVFDCGTGVRGLGLSLLKQNGPIDGSILLGHSHWDHIQGFPFFGPAFIAGNRFTIYAPTGGDQHLASVLAGQMVYTYFPVRLDQMESKIEFHDLGEETFSIADATVQTQYLNHTVLTLGYRVSAGGVSVVYSTDHEPNASSLWQREPGGGPGHLRHPGDQRHGRFMANADLVVHDAQYWGSEYAGKVGWGHSPMEYVVDLAATSGVKRLALFHHDPAHADQELDRLVAAAQERAAGWRGDLLVFGACEGETVELAEQGLPRAAVLTPSGPSLPKRGRILIAEDDPEVRTLLTATLIDDDYELITAGDGQEALELALAARPDLVLLDLTMPHLDGLEVCRRLRQEPGLADLPIIILSGSASEANMADGFAGGATDYMAKPFSPSMVRTRVRSWLLRQEGGRG